MGSLDVRLESSSGRARGGRGSLTDFPGLQLNVSSGLAQCPAQPEAWRCSARERLLWFLCSLYQADPLQLAGFRKRAVLVFSDSKSEV